MGTRLTLALARKLGFEIRRGGNGKWYADCRGSDLRDRRAPGFATRRRAVAEVVAMTMCAGDESIPSEVVSEAASLI